MRDSKSIVQNNGKNNRESQALLKATLYKAVKLSEHELVDDMITQYPNMAVHAMQYYAAFRNDKKVEEFLLKGMDIGYAVFGYAISNNHQRVDELINRGANRAVAVHGYNSIGNHEKVEEHNKLGANRIANIYEDALNGNNESVLKHLRSYPVGTEERNDASLKAVTSYISIKRYDVIDELIASCDVPLKIAIVSYIQAKNHTKAYEYLIKYGDNKDRAFELLRGYLTTHTSIGLRHLVMQNGIHPEKVNPLFGMMDYLIAANDPKRIINQSSIEPFSKEKQMYFKGEAGAQLLKKVVPLFIMQCSKSFYFSTAQIANFTSELKQITALSLVSKAGFTPLFGDAGTHIRCWLLREDCMLNVIHLDEVKFREIYAQFSQEPEKTTAQFAEKLKEQNCLSQGMFKG